MATTKMQHGAVVIPQSLREAHGLEDGTEFEVIDGGKEIRLRPLSGAGDDKVDGKTLSAQEFLAVVCSFPKFEGPPVTDEMIHEAINQAAIDDWERLEQEWNEDKDD